MNRSISQIKTLVFKDLKIEWRLQNNLNGLLLYVICIVFVCYLSFNVKMGSVSPITWNTLLWIILLFTAINSINKSMEEINDRFYFYYTLVSPQIFIIAKIIYNSIIMFLISCIGLILYIFTMGNPVKDLLLFVFNIFLGVLSFSNSLTMIAAIAAKSTNSSSLTAILGFPLILPMILMLIKVSKNALDGLTREVSYDEITIILSLNIIVFFLSYILFPYLWQE